MRVQLVIALLWASAAWAQPAVRVVLGGEGVSWQSGGNGVREPTVLIKPRARAVTEDTTNTPGNAIEFANRRGWISPLFFDPEENVSSRVLEGAGFVFLQGAFYGAGIDVQLRGTVNGDHRVAFERRPDLFNVAPKMRDVWVELDFAVPIGIHRVRFYPRNTVVPEPQFPFQEDFLRAYEVWVNSTKTSASTPDVLVARNTANANPVVDVEVAPQYARQVKVRSLSTVPYEYDEIEVYGTGYMAEGVYLSDILSFEDRATIGPLRWVEEAIGDSLFSEVTVRMRTGTDDTPLNYGIWVRDSEGQVTGTRFVHPTAYYAQPRTERTPLGGEDDDNWSPWNKVENGELTTAPVPRRYVQFRLEFAGDLFRTRAVDQLAFEYLVPPIADGLLAEVYPRLAEAEQPASFRYALRLAADGPVRGYDRLAVDTNGEVTAIRKLRLDGVALDYEVDYIREDGFGLRFPLIDRDGALLEFTFDLPIFRFGTTFSGRVSNSQAPGVPQRLAPGNATVFAPDDIGELSGLFVAIPKKQLGKLVGKIVVPRRVFTPNGDGANDTFELFFNLLQLLEPVPVALEVFDLSGRRVEAIFSQDRGIGPAEYRWDGRLADGGAVAPGMYVWVLRVRADAFEEVHTGVVGVAY
ncbi:MAG: hypothetical protein HOI20_26100 [Gemmatimonadetes bacterium]|nr:hypothetical protein [Gemmatimonadota bacterium]